MIQSGTHSSATPNSSGCDNVSYPPHFPPAHFPWPASETGLLTFPLSLWGHFCLNHQPSPLFTPISGVVQPHWILTVLCSFSALRFLFSGPWLQAVFMWLKILDWNVEDQGDHLLRTLQEYADCSEMSGLKGQNQGVFFAQERNLYCEAGNLGIQTQEHRIWLFMESTPCKISAEELIYKNRLPLGSMAEAKF